MRKNGPTRTVLDVVAPQRLVGVYVTVQLPYAIAAGVMVAVTLITFVSPAVNESGEVAVIAKPEIEAAVEHVAAKSPALIDNVPALVVVKDNDPVADVGVSE